MRWTVPGGNASFRVDDTAAKGILPSKNLGEFTIAAVTGCRRKLRAIARKDDANVPPNVVPP